MKNYKRLLIIFLILIIGLFSVNQYKNVKADSGWDTSYDSGSSSSSESSWSSGSFRSSSSSSGSGGGEYILYPMMSFLVFLIFNSISESISKKNKKIIFAIFILIWILATYLLGIMIMSIIGMVSFLSFGLIAGIVDDIKLDRQKRIKKKEIKEEILNKYVDKSLNEIKEEFYDKFVKIQEAWMNFDYKVLKQLCNNEIYNIYLEELEALKLKNGQNIMSDFTLIDNKIVDIIKEKDSIILSYYLDVKFYDYVINTKTNAITKGNKKRRVHNIYYLKFVKSNKVIDNCPNCSGKIESGTTTCSHCKAVILQDSNEFVMCEKRKINQFK